MRSMVLLALPALVGCFPNVASDQRVDDLDEDLDALREELAAMDADHDAELAALQAQHEAEVAELQAQVTDLELLVTELGGDLETLESRAVTVIEADTTYDVSSVAELESALAELAMARILPGVTVTIDLADGVYSLDEPVQIDHPDGRQIRLVGDEADPDAVKLSFTGTSGVVVPAGRSLGTLAGVTLAGDGGDYGVVVEANGTLSWGALRISGFSVGVMARDGGVIQPEDASCASSWIEVTSGGTGVAARDGGIVDVCGAVVSGMTGNGYYADYLGLLMAGGSSATGNALDGYIALYGAAITAAEAISTENQRYGFDVQYGALLMAQGAVNEGGLDGFVAYAGVVAQVQDTVSSSTSNSAFTADNVSVMVASRAAAIDAARVGFVSSSTSSLYAYGATVSGSPIGFDASLHGNIDARHTEATGSEGATYAYRPYLQGSIYTDDSSSASGYATTVISEADTSTYGFWWD